LNQRSWRDALAFTSRKRYRDPPKNQAAKGKERPVDGGRGRGRGFFDFFFLAGIEGGIEIHRKIKRPKGQSDPDRYRCKNVIKQSSK
jgi:hypothetical protein